MSHLPQNHPAHQQESISIVKLQSILPRDLFLLRAEDGGDYGVDRVLEVIDKGAVTNVRSHIQVKSVNARTASDGSLKFKVSIKTVNYLLNTINSMFLVYSVPSNIFFWDWTRQIALAADRKGIGLETTAQKTITSHFVRTLTPESFVEIHEKLLQDSSTLRRIGLDKGALRESFVPKADTPALYSELLILYLQQKYEAVISISRGSEIDDVAASNLVALSYYHVRNYREALKENARTLARSPTDRQAKRTLAMILCEKGIEERNLGVVRRARKTMLELDREEWEWDDYYNSGNIASALGEHAEALAYYETALQASPNEPMVWKNMATCYFHQEDHKRSLECLDRALEIDENLIEALVSKANVLRELHSMPQQAAALLKKALERSNTDYFDNSVIYYWLAKSLSDAGDPDQALAVVAEGLTLHPGYAPLEDMRLKVLIEHWKDREHLREAALRFLKAAVEKHPKAFSLRTALVEMYVGLNRLSDAYAFIVSTFEQLDFECPEHVLSRFPIPELATLVAHLGTYLEYRARNSIGHDLFSNFDISIETVQRIELVFAMKFARLVVTIEPNQSQGSLLENVEQYVAGFREILITCSGLIAECYRDVPVEKQVEIVTEIVSSLPEIILRELMRQVGWWLNKSGYRARAIDQVIRDSERIGQWFLESVEPVLTGVHNAIPWTERRAEE